MTKDEVFGSNQNTNVKPSEVTAESGSKFIGATFLYLTIALLVTFAVVGALSTLIHFNEDAILGNIETFLAIYIAAIIAYIPILIWVHIAGRRNGRTIGPAFYTYSIVMGVLISPACLVAGFWTVIIALGTTCLAFAVMALIAWTTKKNLSSLAVVGFGLLVGALVLSLFNIILSLFVGFQPLYWLVSFLFFIAIILLTIFDLNNVKRIAMNGGAERNVAFLCALNLYVDFIYIFIRILYYVMMLFGNRR